MLVDFHVHTVRCHHAVGTMEQYIERALALGIDEFGFSDHAYWMLQEKGEHSAMSAEEMPDYVTDVRHMQAKYNRDGAKPFHVRLGLEMDYIPSRVHLAREMAGCCEWDYLIGSIHCLGFWLINNPDQKHHGCKYCPEDICEFYFHVLGRMVRDRFCDVIGHLDILKRFGGRPIGGFLRWLEPLLPTIKEAGMAVEINTAGIDSEANDVFPGWEEIAALAAAGVPLTLGSDAHAPEQVGRHFPEVVATLRQIGLKEIARFEKRRIIMIPL